jgi:uncharacterized membrane protein
MKHDYAFNTWLFSFFAFIGLLIAARIFFSGNMDYLFLAWNLFLAWLPYMISNGFGKMHLSHAWKQLLLFCTWIILFPNALYIVTDLIHLEDETAIPKWFDTILIFTSSIVGLIMAFISLMRVENYLGKKYDKKLIKWMVGGILFLGSFGVYIGRFLRWNSWDIISNPVGLLKEVGHRFIYPLAYSRAWGITFILTTLFYLLYAGIKKMPGQSDQALVL